MKSSSLVYIFSLSWCEFGVEFELKKMFLLRQLMKLHGVEMHKIITCMYNLGTSSFHTHDIKKIYSIHSATVILYLPPM